MINLTNEYRMSESLEPQMNKIYDEGIQECKKVVANIKEKKRAIEFDNFFESEYESLLKSSRGEDKRLPLGEQAQFKSDIKRKTLSSLRKNT